MNNKWLFLVTLWLNADGIKEFLLEVDLNDYEEDFFRYYKDNEEEITNMIKKRTYFDSDNTKISIHDCREVEYEIMSFV